MFRIACSRCHPDGLKRGRRTDSLTLRAAIAHWAAGQDLGTALGGTAGGLSNATVGEALDSAADAGGVDVRVDYTFARVGQGQHPRGHRAQRRCRGSSGVAAGECDEIDTVACTHDVGVIAAGNFSLTAATATAATPPAGTAAGRHRSTTR
jgi:4-hydroxy-tetrahydrodipicolinate reductase